MSDFELGNYGGMPVYQAPPPPPVEAPEAEEVAAAPTEAPALDTDSNVAGPTSAIGAAAAADFAEALPWEAPATPAGPAVVLSGPPPLDPSAIQQFEGRNTCAATAVQRELARHPEAYAQVMDSLLNTGEADLPMDLADNDGTSPAPGAVFTKIALSPANREFLAAHADELSDADRMNGAFQAAVMDALAAQAMPNDGAISASYDLASDTTTVVTEYEETVYDNSNIYESEMGYGYNGYYNQPNATTNTVTNVSSVAGATAGGSLNAIKAAGGATLDANKLLQNVSKTYQDLRANANREAIIEAQNQRQQAFQYEGYDGYNGGMDQAPAEIGPAQTALNEWDPSKMLLDGIRATLDRAVASGKDGVWTPVAIGTGGRNPLVGWPGLGYETTRTSFQAVDAGANFHMQMISAIDDAGNLTLRDVNGRESTLSAQDFLRRMPAGSYERVGTGTTTAATTTTTTTTRR